MFFPYGWKVKQIDKAKYVYANYSTGPIVVIGKLFWRHSMSAYKVCCHVALPRKEPLWRPQNHNCKTERWHEYVPWDWESAQCTPINFYLNFVLGQWQVNFSEGLYVRFMHADLHYFCTELTSVPWETLF